MITEVPVLTDDTFRKIRDLVYKQFGILLTPQKRSLVLARLQKVLQQNGFTNFEDYLEFLLNDSSGKTLNTFINKISTNHTYFNREAQHFDFLKKEALPQLMNRIAKQSSQNKIHIWSAGCSTGEEPYQIAMELIEFLGDSTAQNKTAILATDISSEALVKAQEGTYFKENVEQLPKSYVLKYFQPVDEKIFQVKPVLQRLILFKRLNLVRSEFPFKKKFHVIFCRNVMIYFDQATKARLIAKFYQHLSQGGYLFLGHSESIPPKNKYFKYVRPAVYQKGD